MLFNEALTGLKAGVSREITPKHNPPSPRLWRGSYRLHPRAKSSWFFATANKKLTATLLAALILTSATNTDAMGWSFTAGWKKWPLVGTFTAVAALVIKKIWATPQSTPAPQVVPAVNNQANALGQELIAAAKADDFSRVQDLINCGADVNTQNEHGITALMHAANNNNTVIAQALIAAHADVNAHDNSGDTALILAAEDGNTEIAQALIAAGADVNAQVRESSAALLHAAYSGHTKIAQALIAADADLNIQNNAGNTALIYAASSGHTEIAQALIAAGADVNAQGQYGDTALMWAARNGLTKIAQLLIDAGANVNAQDRYGNTALMWAARNFHWHIADLILNAMHIQQTPEARATLLIAKTPQNAAGQTHAAAREVGHYRILFRKLFETIRPELPTYQWLQEQLGRHYAAYREWKRTQPGEERFDENYNPNRAVARPAGV